ncbi:hypothetical protein V3C99_015647, partial [Haemonchus contortus]
VRHKQTIGLSKPFQRDCFWCCS